MTKLLFPGIAIAAILILAGQARADILIGIGAPLTGPNAAMGAQIKRGAEAAVAEINANRGINGERIELTYGDDVSDPKQGISVANKFVADGVKFVAGHYNCGVSIPASEVYAENGILQTTPASTNPKHTRARPVEYISYLRPAMTNRARLPALLLPSTSRMRILRSSMIRHSMVKASPMKPRKR